MKRGIYKKKRHGRRKYPSKSRWGSLVWLFRWMGGITLAFLASALMIEVYDYALTSPYFQLKGVTLIGCERLKEREVIRLMGVSGRTNVLALDLKEAARRIERNPWVAHASVYRELPDELRVRIRERKPVALVSLDRLYYLDGEGTVFLEAGPGGPLNYPIVTGVGRNDLHKDRSLDDTLKHRLLTLLALLQERNAPLPLSQVAEIHVEQRGALSLLTRDRVRIRFGTEKYGEKLRRLAAVMEDLHQKDLWHLTQSIDLDFKYQAVVKYRNIRRNLEKA